jgi:hypothetical protein
MKLLLRIHIFILFLGISALLKSQNNDYSFFAAGHTYGNPNHIQYGIHQNFVDYFPILNNDPKMELGFLTGDVVYQSTPAYWDSAQIDLDVLEMPYYIAAGNHDMGAEFVNRYGDYYFSFQHQQDLFIVLTPGLSQWNIEGEQLAFLENILETYAADSRYIFIMLHQLIWWSPTNIYQDVIINWIPQYPGSTNFDEVVKPLLLSYSNPIYMYAGDLGSKPSVSPCMYHQIGNLHLIASGMGSLIYDNIIITNVSNEGVELDLVAINGDGPDSMGELTDWAVNLNTQEYQVNSFFVYPNPSNSTIYIESTHLVNSANKPTVSIYNSIGKQVDEFIPNETTNAINISSFPSGIYFFVIKDQGAILETHKVMVE